MTDPKFELPVEISVQEVRALMDAGEPVRWLDVRQDEEIEIAAIEGTEHLTRELADELIASGDRSARLVFICHAGMRSMGAAHYFAERGFTRAQSMAGGIDAWSREIDPAVPRY